MTTFTVVSASVYEMQDMADYGLTVEAAFTTREQAEAHAGAMNDEQGHSYLFWVLTAEELAAVA
jgi:hypothetical protein